MVNGNPLQCSCLENSRDGEAWYSAVYGVARVGHDWSHLAVAAAAHLSFSTLMLPTFRAGKFLAGASQVVLVVKNPPAKAGDIRDSSLIPGWGRSPGGGNGNPLQYSCQENPTERVPGRLQSMGSQRVQHDWKDLAQHNTVLSCGDLYFVFWDI